MMVSTTNADQIPTLPRDSDQSTSSVEGFNVRELEDLMLTAGKEGSIVASSAASGSARTSRSKRSVRLSSEPSVLSPPTPSVRKQSANQAGSFHTQKGSPKGRASIRDSINSTTSTSSKDRKGTPAARATRLAAAQHRSQPSFGSARGSSEPRLPSTSASSRGTTPREVDSQRGLGSSAGGRKRGSARAVFTHVDGEAADPLPAKKKDSQSSIMFDLTPSEIGAARSTTTTTSSSGRAVPPPLTLSRSASVSSSRSSLSELDVLESHSAPPHSSPREDSSRRPFSPASGGGGHHRDHQGGLKRNGSRRKSGLRAVSMDSTVASDKRPRGTPTASASSGGGGGGSLSRSSSRSHKGGRKISAASSPRGRVSAGHSMYSVISTASKDRRGTPAARHSRLAATQHRTQKPFGATQSASEPVLPSSSTAPRTRSTSFADEKGSPLSSEIGVEQPRPPFFDRSSPSAAASGGQAEVVFQGGAVTLHADVAAFGASEDAKSTRTGSPAGSRPPSPLRHTSFDLGTGGGAGGAEGNTESVPPPRAPGLTEGDLNLCFSLHASRSSGRTSPTASSLSGQGSKM